MFHGAANAPQLRRGIVRKRAVGFDLAAKLTQQGLQVGVAYRQGECGDARPVAKLPAALRNDQAAPCGDALHQSDQRENLQSLERRPLDARFLKLCRRVKEAMKVEASSSDVERPHL